MNINQVVLSGIARGRSVLRFTPVGIPIVEFNVHHTSTQREADATRQVELELPVIAFGRLAERMSVEPPDVEVTARGFLARRSRNSTQVVLHATEIEFQES